MKRSQLILAAVVLLIGLVAVIAVGAVLRSRQAPPLPVGDGGAPSASEPVPGPGSAAGGTQPSTGKEALIRVESPVPGEAISSPLVVRGEARGPWYFEATFPVTLLDAGGEVVLAHYAQARDEWMTNDFVPFTATLVFDAPKTADGVLVLSKSNASGLPEHDDELRIPVRFAVQERADGGRGASDGGCRRTGCSGQVCAESDIMTTCEFRPEYACYRDAVCERQADGSCGWTMSPALRACLESSASE
jgi:hypothetical protein